MPRLLDLTDRPFGRLTARRLLPKRGPHREWLCDCACGRSVAVKARCLTAGFSTHCGCRAAENLSASHRSARAVRHAKRLTMCVWPLTCPTCGRQVVGTARQVYCSPECRPSRRRTT